MNEFSKTTLLVDTTVSLSKNLIFAFLFWFIFWHYQNQHDNLWLLKLIRLEIAQLNST